MGKIEYLEWLWFYLLLDSCAPNQMGVSYHTWKSRANNLILLVDIFASTSKLSR